MFRRMRILCVDDEPVSLELMKILLNRFGFEVSMASSAHEALTLMEAEKPFYMVISDYHMPDMNGTELLVLIKELSPETVRTLTSGGICQYEAEEFISSGYCDYFLPKPWSIPRLIEMFYNGLTLWC